MRQDAGVDGDAQRISQLVWMIFLKVFDAKEEEWELIKDDYEPIIPEGLRWRDWAANDEGITGDELMDFANNTLFPSLKGMELDESSDPKAFLVRDVFADSYNYMKSGTLMRLVINKLNEIDFTAQKDRHMFNDVYESILRDLQSAGNAGEYYTPRAVTQFMVDMVNPQLGEKVLDFACGTGGFLVCALENLRKQVKNVADARLLNESIIGIEKKPLPYMLAVTNMILHDIDEPRIRHGNSLTRNVRDYRPADQVDIVVTNPPFGGIEEDGIEVNFPIQYRTKETADLFLVLLMHLLKDNGRAAIVLPDGFLFGEGVKTSIKEDLLREFNLHTIVRLPNGVFSPYTDINTNLLFLQKGEPTREIWYVEHPLPEGYRSYTKTRPITVDEFEYLKQWWNDRVEGEMAWRVPIEEIRNRGYNLDITNALAEATVVKRTPAELIADIAEREQTIVQLLAEIKKTLEV